VRTAYPELKEEEEPEAVAAQARRLAERERGAATGWALRPGGGSTGDGDLGEGRRGRKVAGTAAAGEAAMVAFLVRPVCGSECGGKVAVGLRSGMEGEDDGGGEGG